MTTPFKAVLFLSSAGFATCGYGALLQSGRTAARASEPAEVLASRYGRRFGIPITIWGIAFHLLILTTTALRLVQDSPVIVSVDLAAAAIAAVYGGWLIFILVMILQKACPLCHLAHLINFALVIALLASVG